MKLPHIFMLLLILYIVICKFCPTFFFLDLFTVQWTTSYLLVKTYIKSSIEKVSIINLAGKRRPFSWWV